ncbi:MAG: hypothetical protein AAF609_08060 [Cyanobacteria bacterium P01_C01_bin.120]
MFNDPRPLTPSDPFHICPRCGKQAMKEVEQNHFHCIWCGFDRRINDLSDNNLITALAIVIATCLIVVLLSL